MEAVTAVQECPTQMRLVVLDRVAIKTCARLVSLGAESAMAWMEVTPISERGLGMWAGSHHASSFTKTLPHGGVPVALVFALVSLFRRGMRARSNSSQNLPLIPRQTLLPVMIFTVQIAKTNQTPNEAKPADEMLSRSRWGISRGGGLVPRILSATPVGVVGAFLIVMSTERTAHPYSVPFGATHLSVLFRN